MTLSQVAAANTLFMQLATADKNVCDAKTAEIVIALGGQPIEVGEYYQHGHYHCSSSGSGRDRTRTCDGVAPLCNAALSSTGNREVVLRTVKSAGQCTANQERNSLLAGALYLNECTECSHFIVSIGCTCVIDGVFLK